MTGLRSWYDLLDQVEHAVHHDNHIQRVRLAAGWQSNEGVWFAPDGTSEFDWLSNGFPLPEHQGFGNWFRRHTGSDDPFPNAETV